MATYYINSLTCSKWLADTSYSLGDRVYALPSNSSGTKKARVYECTTAGTSGGSEPNWTTTVGNTTSDNSVVWTTRAPSTWANAHGSLHLFLATTLYHAAGDVIKVHKDHNEAIDGTEYADTIYVNGTYNNPVIIACVDKDNSDALATGAVVANTRDKNLYKQAISINIHWKFGGNVNCLGILGWLFVGDGNITAIELTGASNRFGEMPTEHFFYSVINANIKLANAANYILPGGEFIWKGGALIAPNGCTKLFDQNSGEASCTKIFVEDVDLTAVGAGTLVNVTVAPNVHGVFSRCKLPSNLTAKVSAFENQGYSGVIKFHHCSYGDGAWGSSEHTAEGRTEASSTVYRSNGASDGTTSIGWKIVTTAALTENMYPHYSPDISFWQEVAEEITVEMHGIIDSATNLQDDEVWLEVSYREDSTSGLGTFKTTKKFPPFETASDLPTSTETWNGTGGMSNPNKFKLSATFTPAAAGPVNARVGVGKPSTTLYVCPKLGIS